MLALLIAAGVACWLLLSVLFVSLCAISARADAAQAADEAGRARELESVHAVRTMPTRDPAPSEPAPRDPAPPPGRSLQLS